VDRITGERVSALLGSDCVDAMVERCSGVSGIGEIYEHLIPSDECSLADDDRSLQIL